MRSAAGFSKRHWLAVIISLLIAGLVWLRLDDGPLPWRNSPRVLSSGAAQEALGAQARWIAARDSSLLVAVSLSGGGARAAAFGYGVLRELQDSPFEWNDKQTNLLDATDVIAGVSGGSIAAAYYAAFGQEGLAGFEQDFLRSNLQNSLLVQGAKPTNWRRLASPGYGRTHLLEQRLDTVFRGMTFGDLMRRQRHPQLLVSATDLTQGAGFEFTAEQFHLLCSDFQSVPLSFAVAASSAVPVLLSPMTLRNYSRQCGDDEAEHLPAPPHAQDYRARLYELQQQSYLDSINRPYIHLVDGGVADNLGIRRLLDRALAGASLRQGFEEVGIAAGSVRRLVLITVNAERDPNERLDAQADIPGALQVIDAMRFGSGSRATHETQEFLADLALQWRTSLRATGENDIFSTNARIHVVQVNLRDSPVSGEARAKLLHMPTTLSLPADQITELIAAGRNVLRESKDFQKLLADLKTMPTSEKR